MVSFTILLLCSEHIVLNTHKFCEQNSCRRMDVACVNCLLFWFFPSSRLTCAFLACKVDEFNVSSAQFVGNLRESPLGQEKALEQILEYELLLIQQLNFHLIIHNPYRPFEGFLIDIKVKLSNMLCALCSKVIKVCYALS